MNNTFEQRLAYEIGVKLAQEAYFNKESSAGLKQMWGGVKGVLGGGGGGNMGQAFSQGAVGAGARAGEGGFRQIAKNIYGEAGKGFQNQFKTFGAKRTQAGINSSQRQLESAQKAHEAAIKGGKHTAEQLKVLETNIQNAQKNVEKFKTQAQGYSATTKAVPAAEGQSAIAAKDLTGTDAVAHLAQQGYTPAQRAWQAGAGLTALGAGYGAYNLGRSAVGANTPQPQQSPHSYYWNQMFGR